MLGLIDVEPSAPPARPPTNPLNTPPIVGDVVTFPDPVMFGISRKLKGLSFEARIIFIKILFIWYCSNMFAYFSDILEKSGVTGVVHPPTKKTNASKYEGSLI